MILLTSNTLLPDLTHPQELVQVGQQMLELAKTWVMLLIAIGFALAALNGSFQRRDRRPDWFTGMMGRYGQFFAGLQPILLILVIMVSGFLLCSTLANRYHHWEQDKLTQAANSVAGERIEQAAPVVRYTVDEPYTSFTYLNGKPTEVERIRQVDRFLTPSGSQISVDITQTTDPATERYIYQSNVRATYQVTNTVDVTQFFQFEAPPPSGYTLLQNYRIERDRQRLVPQNQEYKFPITLAPQESTTFQITYQAQGAPRWVFNANGRLLSKFDLKMVTHFPNAEFASGVVPTSTQVDGTKTQFIWKFEDNVSVRNPFGVFTATQRFRNTGILPRLLILAPGVFLWWMLMLYCSVPVRLIDVVMSATVFFTVLLGLTYASRLIDARWAWGLLLWILLLWGWRLGQQHQTGGGGVFITLSSVVLPVAALLVPYTGLTLAISGLLSVVWLILRYQSPVLAPPSAETTVE